MRWFFLSLLSFLPLSSQASIEFIVTNSEQALSDAQQSAFSVGCFHELRRRAGGATKGSNPRLAIVFALVASTIVHRLRAGVERWLVSLPYQFNPLPF